MQLGMVGLGRMGANIVRRLMREGMWSCLRSAPSPSSSLRGRSQPGLTMRTFVAQTPRAVRVMIRRALPGRPSTRFAGLLDEGDITIDGGNLQLPRRCTAGS